MKSHYKRSEQDMFSLPGPNDKINDDENCVLCSVFIVKTGISN